MISLSILKNANFTLEERDSYIRYSNALRKMPAEEDDSQTSESPQSSLSEDRIHQLSQDEQFIISITQKGFGKRSSAYAYRVTNRGGQGFANIDVCEKNGLVVASFPVDEKDHLVLVTNGGQVIRCPVHDIRFTGRRTQGVTIFRVAEGERVVSVSRIQEPDEEETFDPQEADDNSTPEAPSDDGTP